jgi:predicted amidohydrolase
MYALIISILQPEIERGNIHKNVAVIQRLINNSNGDLLVLAEYALTGSLVLDENADIQKWAKESEFAKQELYVPENKKLLLNSLIIKDKLIYNACTLLPDDKIMQIKTIPDKTEVNAGIHAGNAISAVELNETKIIIVICSDFAGLDKISTCGADIILFIYHFTPENYQNRLADIISISKERNIPIITASLVSDKNYGHSCYICGSTVVAMGNREGIMEITL